ncbi:DUF4158 domain-containing protein [Nonomuraea sp. NPDC049028]|uniref:DUF4158 domain-containing protein n=1 Tax=Nonomuraea sp. NPDC049028 TaxID=3364348 RepID=UPI0037177C3E
MSAAHVDRYGRFAVDPTPEELERFFFLDAAALKEARDKRRLHNRLGWAIQWGTVRILGTFLTDSGPADVPQVVVEYVAHDDPAGQSLRVGGDVVAYGEQVNQLRGRTQGLLAFFR